MELELVDLWKIGLAMLIGGIIGAEREYRDKAAGFRTNILICVGSTIFTILSVRLAGDAHDVTRIAAGIVSGIGFLGAGAILRKGDHIRGLTTASGIWTIAALGMAIGGGYFMLAIVAAGAVMVVLWILPTIEHYIDHFNEARLYKVVCKPEQQHYARLEANFRSHGLSIRSHKQMKEQDRMVCEWLVFGKPTAHDAMMTRLFDDEDVIEFEV